MPPVRFGFCLPIFACPGLALFRTPGYAALDAATTMRLGGRAEELGYDSLWVADHLMLGKDDAILEGWTTLAALAGATRRAKLGMIHQAVFFREPGLAAKMAATLDQISGGRVIHFMDCGHARHEYLAYRLPWSDDADERVAHLAEATELTLALWSADGPIKHDGRFYHLADAICAPKPVQQPHPPLWFGEVNPGVLELCARHGQGWNTTPVSLPELQRRLTLLNAACERADRSPTEIEKSLETQVLIVPDRARLRQAVAELVALADAQREPGPTPTPRFSLSTEAEAKLRDYVAGNSEQPPAWMTDSWLIGTPDEVADRLHAYIGAGIDHFMLWFMDAPETDGLHLFAESVMPRFR